MKRKIGEASWRKIRKEGNAMKGKIGKGEIGKEKIAQQ
jgi:hypothetical protein